MKSSTATWFILSIERERTEEQDKRVLYRTVPEFIRLISKANAAAICPGYPETT